MEPNTRVSAILSELPPRDTKNSVGEPLRVFHLGGEELPDDDLYSAANGDER